ncbi:hypothetical protein [Dongia sp.]|uniref:hypothetical protein n=1 Tax=Dongia sp. TaxID=1977262 RepID=UPI0035AF801C
MSAALAETAMPDLQDKANRLRQRRSEIVAELSDNGHQQQAQALKAALGDAQAKRGFERLLGRGAELAAQAAALDTAMLEIDATIMSAEAAAMQASHVRRTAELADLQRRRLLLAGEIDANLRKLLPLVARFINEASEIERRHQSLGGARLILAPLSAEMVKGRLAEFMAGLGYDAFLPLIRPEARPALMSLHEAEAAAQATYDFARDTGPARKESA